MTMRYTLAMPQKLLRDIQGNPAFGHRIIMSLYHDSLNSQHPRKSENILWTITQGNLLLSADCAPYEKRDITILDSHPTPYLKQGDIIPITITLDATHSVSSPLPAGLPQEFKQLNLRSKRYPVPHKEVPEWVREKFDRFGFTSHYLTLKKTPLVCDKKRTIPAYHITTELTVRDVQLAQQSLEQGIGRSKNYGCGLLLINN